MSGKRLIIHLENGGSTVHIMQRIVNALPEYYRLKPDDGRRLTVRFDENNVMAIYHNPHKDLVFFTEAKE